MKKTAILLGLGLMLPFTASWAVEPGDEITMEVVEGTSPEALMRRIELPEQANLRAREQARTGLDTANQAQLRNQERHQLHQEESDARREQRREMVEQRAQMQEQRREMHEERRQLRDEMQPAMEPPRGR